MIVKHLKRRPGCVIYAGRDVLSSPVSQSYTPCMFDARFSQSDKNAQNVQTWFHKPQKQGGTDLGKQKSQNIQRVKVNFVW